MTKVAASVLEQGATFIPLRGKAPVRMGGHGIGVAQQLPAEERGLELRGNRGLLTGHSRVQLPSGDWTGVCVIDVDVKPGQRGRETLAELEAMLGPLPATLTARTPSGGLHLYFVMPDFAGARVSNKVFGRNSGIDFQNEGQFVVFPGGVIADGPFPGTYEWIDRAATVAELPAEWLVHLMKAPAPRAEGEHEEAPPPIDVTSEDGARVVEDAIKWCLEEAPVAVKGNNGQTTLLEVAGKLVRHYRLPLEVARELIVSAWSPRCTPPSSWRDQHIDRKLSEAVHALRFPEWGMGWSEKKMAEVEQKMKATAKGLRPGVTPKRRQHNPAHIYSFVPGRDVLKTTDEPKAALLVDVANKLATHPAWEGCLQWDEFRGRVVAVDPPLKMDAESGGRISDDDINNVRQWLSCNGMLVSEGDCMAAIRSASRQNAFHPVREYLESCRGRGRGRGLLATLAQRLFGNADPYANLFLEKFLVSAVRRAMQPGCRVDTVLVLVGKQGVRKTTFVQHLFGPEFTRTQMPSLENKDASAALAEFWGVELGEFHRVMKADKDSVKEFLTRTYDDYRPAYGKCDIRQARRVVFVGTSNEMGVLADSTGDRRYWPIEVKRVDIGFLDEFRDVIWGEALELAEDANYKHWFDDEDELKAAKEDFIVLDPWQEIIEFYLRGRTIVTVKEIFADAISGGQPDFTKLGRAQEMRIADVLRRLGCEKMKKGKVTWEIPQDLSEQKLEAKFSASEKLRNAN